MSAIDGLKITPLKTVGDERGKVMRMLRSDDPHFTGFGEAYFSVINPGVTKGWKTHLRTVQNLAVPHGRITFILRDDRPGSPTAGQATKIVLSAEDPKLYRLLSVPPGVGYAWRNESDSPSVVANCQAPEPHDPTESVNAPLDENPPDWEGTPEG
ncbi:dTDP-4-dehydrorhamnose 3,5-epimerase family protein [Candidatus Uhrbacteria bacterium]|nr:dTDP-4-dehydrorhamnose 3,5-epimerase family protein [Candidatus Uhrbacteria bacterium]